MGFCIVGPPKVQCLLGLPVVLIIARMGPGSGGGLLNKATKHYYGPVGEGCDQPSAVASCDKPTALSVFDISVSPIVALPQCWSSDCGMSCRVARTPSCSSCSAPGSPRKWSRENSGKPFWDICSWQESAQTIVLKSSHRTIA